MVGVGQSALYAPSIVQAIAQGESNTHRLMAVNVLVYMNGAVDTSQDNSISNLRNIICSTFLND
jgi:hypothetical protein